MTITQPVFHIFDPEIELTRPVVDEAARSLYEMCLTEVHAPMENIRQAFRWAQVRASILSNQYQKLYKRIEKWRAIPSDVRE